MNSYITFACLLAVVGLCHGSGYGLGGYYGGYPLAVSSANLYKPSIPIVKVVKPIVPIVKIPVISSGYGLGLGGGLGYGGLGYGGLGYGGLGYGGLGYGYGGYGYGKGLYGRYH